MIDILSNRKGLAFQPSLHKYFYGCKKVWNVVWICPMNRRGNDWGELEDDGGIVTTQVQYYCIIVLLY